MSTAQRQAISYARFSDLTQGAGDSEDRQARDFAAFCKRHQLTPALDHFTDRGRSGFKGTHRSKGEMGRLEELATAGEFPPEAVIVIEAWDRLGRQRPDKAIEHISKLLRCGLSIGVCRLDDIFTEADFGSYKWAGLSTFVMLAHQESKQKSERVGASWNKRRLLARADRKPMTGRLPAWLELRGGAFVLIPERAAAVARIFQLAADGFGYTRIAQALIAEGFSPFGRKEVKPGMKRSQFSGVWRRLYVARVLNDRRALGEHQPRAAGRKPEGKPIPDYYPAAVTLEQWYRAHHGKEGKDRKPLPRQGKRVNLFAGLLVDSEDGEGYCTHNKGDAKKPQLVLINARGEAGRGPARTFPYQVFEDAILKCLREVPVSVLFPPSAREPARLDVLRAELAHTRQEIAALTEDLSQGFSAAVSAVLRKQEAKAAGLVEALELEQAKAARSPEQDWSEFQDLAAALASVPEKDREAARLRLRAALRRRVREVVLRIVRRGRDRLLVAQCWFVDSNTYRTFLVLYRPAAHHCKGGWWPLSFAASDGLDMRQPDDAKKVEGFLERLDLAAGD